MDLDTHGSSNSPPLESLKLNALLLGVGALGLGLYVMLRLLHDEVLLLSGVLLWIYALLPPVQALEHLIGFAGRRLNQGFQRWGKRVPAAAAAEASLPSQSTFWHRFSLVLKDRLPRVIAVLLVLVCTFTLISLAVVRILPPFKHQLVDVLEALGQHWPSSMSHLMNRLGLHHQELANRELWARFVKQHAIEGIKELLLLLSHSVLGLIHTIVGAVLVFYGLLEGPHLARSVIGFIPASRQALGRQVLTRAHGLLFTFMKTQVTLAWIAGLWLFATCEILGIQGPLFLALSFGLASILPVLGPWLGLLPTLVFVLLTQPERLPLVLLFCAVFYGVKELWLLPALEADNPQKGLEIHPMLVMLAFLLCLQLAGFAGVLLIVPLATGLALVYEFLQERSGIPLGEATETTG